MTSPEPCGNRKHNSTRVFWPPTRREQKTPVRERKTQLDTKNLFSGNVKLDSGNISTASAGTANTCGNTKHSREQKTPCRERNHHRNKKHRSGSRKPAAHVRSSPALPRSRQELLKPVPDCRARMPLGFGLWTKRAVELANAVDEAEGQQQLSGDTPAATRNAKLLQQVTQTSAAMPTVNTEKLHPTTGGRFGWGGRFDRPFASRGL